MTGRRAAALLSLVGLIVPSAACANGDSASHVLLAQRVFLPFSAPVGSDVAKRLAGFSDRITIAAAAPLGVAVIAALPLYHRKSRTLRA